MKTSTPLVFPSLLSADFGNLEREIEMVNTSEADGLHLDIMDGVFVPNITFGFPVLQAVSRLCTKPLDVHLMIEHPEKFIDEYSKLGISLMTVHYEACTHIHRVIHQIKDAGMRVGVAINPGTPVTFLQAIIQDVDVVEIMTVNPGFGGQKFIEHSIDKIKRLQKLMEQMDAHAYIEIDGGVNEETGRRLCDAGADMLVAGSYVFGSKDPKQAIHNLKML